MLNVKSVMLGLAAMVPAAILLTTVGELSSLDSQEEFIPSLSDAFLIGFISVWSCYVLSISTLLQNKRVPTSLEGMRVNAQIGFGFCLGLAPFLYYYFDYTGSILGLGILFLGSMAAGATLGFYIGFSHARFIDNPVKGFVFRQLGLGLATLIMACHILLANKAQTEWVWTVLTTLFICVILFLGIHYIRAARQHRKYVSRRYKQRTPASGQMLAATAV